MESRRNKNKFESEQRHKSLQRTVDRRDGAKVAIATKEMNEDLAATAAIVGVVVTTATTTTTTMTRTTMTTTKKKGVEEAEDDKQEKQDVVAEEEDEDEEEGVSEEPIDYSKKYAEAKKEFGNRERVRDNKVDLFGDYAETDLDQPTDYSLRYAEDDTDDEENQTSTSPAEYFPGQEDTVKTYCTEGTPYETPFNFSTATSMSDLRLEEKETTDHQHLTNFSNTKKHANSSKRMVGNVNHVQESQSSFLSQRRANYQGEANSQGRTDCNRYRNCNENNAGSDWRSNSDYYHHQMRSISNEPVLNSVMGKTCLPSQSAKVRMEGKAILGEGLQEIPGELELVEQERCPVSGSSGNRHKDCSKPGRCSPGSRTELEVIGENIAAPDGVKNNGRMMDKEGKMVTFGGEDYYSEETPLMFSRCSSLGSLSGFEQHSIHDDRSSVVSDFSRRTSGVVSPSELPDSPTQTIPPPSPRNQKTELTESGFLGKMQEEAVRPLVRHLSFPKNGGGCQEQTNRGSVFEDDIATFKEESTPIEFSTATSLSSLTIDEEPRDRLKTSSALAERTNSADTCHGVIAGSTVRENRFSSGASTNDIKAHVNPIKNRRNNVDEDQQLNDSNAQECLLIRDTETERFMVGHEKKNNGQKDVNRESVENIAEEEDDGDDADDGDDDDEDMLAACISMGMQNNRYRQSFKRGHLPKDEPATGGQSNSRARGPSVLAVRYQGVNAITRPVLPTGARIVSPGIDVASTTNSTVRTALSLSSERPVEGRVSGARKGRKPSIDLVVAADTVHVYCTEDTPADISPVGSHSNLSALSMPSVQEDFEETKCSKDLDQHRAAGGLLSISDESSNLSGEDEKILDECIQSGIPKVRQITPPPPMPSAPIASMLPVPGCYRTTAYAEHTEATRQTQFGVTESFPSPSGVKNSRHVDRSSNLDSNLRIRSTSDQARLQKQQQHQRQQHQRQQQRQQQEQQSRRKLQAQQQLQLQQCKLKRNSLMSKEQHEKGEAKGQQEELRNDRSTKERPILDDSPNQSEDEAILMECIRSAMPKVKLKMPSLHECRTQQQQQGTSSAPKVGISRMPLQLPLSLPSPLPLPSRSGSPSILISESVPPSVAASGAASALPSGSISDSSSPLHSSSGSPLPSPSPLRTSSLPASVSVPVPVPVPAPAPALVPVSVPVPTSVSFFQTDYNRSRSERNDNQRLMKEVGSVSGLAFDESLSEEEEELRRIVDRKWL